MKRSEINRALHDMEDMLERFNVKLPEFCYFSPDDWSQKGPEYNEVRDNMLGWDITDYGKGNFSKIGFALITLRNGNLAKKDIYKKTYAEKLIYLQEGQYSPMHFHWSKMEDIINRGGGELLIRVYNSSETEDLDTSNPVSISKDGHRLTVAAGTQIKLLPGESITITPRLYHDFEIVPGTGAVLIGEVSQCNDDVLDNRFYEQMGRFPTIEEDEPPYRLLCNEYPPISM